VPEIAEREPKVISVGFVHVGWAYLGSPVCTRPAQRFVAAEDSLRSAAAEGLRKWCSLPRLETRTKESDTGASIEVANLSAQ
jgi:hypothetical protein